MIIEMVSRGQLPHDIAYGINIPATSRYDRSVTVPTVAEVGQLLAAADKLANSKNAQIQRAWERYRAMLYLAADSGMRPQEYIAVPRSNIDASGVTVDRALERSGHRISTTKTPAGHRYINLSSQTLEMLDHYGQRSSADGNGLLFATSSGRWLNPNNWRNRGFYVACIEAGLVRDVDDEDDKTPRAKFKPYDLRHFYASMLIEQRTSLKRIQYLMGHRDIQTTLNVYGHLIEKADINDDKQPGLLASIQA
jgi:integrase